MQLLDTPQFPAEYRAGAEGARDLLLYLKGEESELDWTFLSPSVIIDPSGKRTAQFITQNDSLIQDNKGESKISLADLAMAFVDALEQGLHIKKRFTVGYA